MEKIKPEQKNSTQKETNPDDILIKCPYCKEEIKQEAIKCKHCGAILKSKLKDFINAIKSILSSKTLWSIVAGLVVFALIIQFVAIPLFEKYKIRQNAIKQYKEYTLNKKEHKGNIYKILEEYPDLDTPIDELNQKIKKVQALIAKKKFDKLVQIEETGGYATEGSKISMTSGFGTKLAHYVTAKNLTDIPLKVSFKFDLEKTTYTTKKHQGWIMTSYSTDVDKYIYKKDNIRSLKLYSKETDYDNAYFDDIHYYIGYYVSSEHSDGSYRYKWDDTKNFKAVNLTIKSIEIYR